MKHLRARMRRNNKLKKARPYKMAIINKTALMMRLSWSASTAWVATIIRMSRSRRGKTAMMTTLAPSKSYQRSKW